MRAPRPATFVPPAACAVPPLRVGVLSVLRVLSALGMALAAPRAAAQRPRPSVAERAEVAAIVVGPNVRVSAAYPDAMQTEGLIAADPADASRLFGCTMMYSDADGAMVVVGYLSTDGGASWRPTFRTDPKRYVMDPTCAYGPDGTAYMVTAPRYGGHDMWLQRSTDGGATWDSAGAMEVLDRQYVVVDDGAGPRHGRIYVHGSGTVGALGGDEYVDDLALYTSSDGGATFRGTARAALGGRAVLGVGNGVVLSDGTWLAVFGEVRRTTDDDGASLPTEPDDGSASAGRDGWLRTVRSRDGGASLEAEGTVDSWRMPWPPFSTSVVPYLAVDPGSPAFRDRLYVVWPDARAGHVGIRSAYSADGGRTWSKSVALDDAPPSTRPADGRDHFMPTVAVNSAGVVGVAWQDRRDAPDNLGWSVRFRASLDGGETFLPSVRVSEKDAAFGATDRWTVHRATARVPGGGAPGGPPLTVSLTALGFMYSGGHTAGIAADAGGRFHPYWVDNRTGVHQVWTAAVTVRGDVARNGSRMLADYADVTDRVALDVTDLHYARATNLLTATVRVRNTSADTVRAPLALRLLAVQSEVGVASVRTGDRVGEVRAGAVFDLAPPGGAGALPPGASTAPRTLTFHLADVRPFRQGRDFRLGLVTFDARVLSGGRSRPAGEATAAPAVHGERTEEGDGPGPSMGSVACRLTQSVTRFRLGPLIVRRSARFAMPHETFRCQTRMARDRRRAE